MALPGIDLPLSIRPMTYVWDENLGEVSGANPDLCIERTAQAAALNRALNLPTRAWPSCLNVDLRAVRAAASFAVAGVLASDRR